MAALKKNTLARKINIGKTKQKAEDDRVSPKSCSDNQELLRFDQEEAFKSIMKELDVHRLMLMELLNKQAVEDKPSFPNDWLKKFAK